MDPAIIASGIQAAGTGFNTISQINMNKQSRRYATYMYDRQRADALADWKQQADYNSPAAQMGRLKEAGLNPNLVYGNGADAQMSSPVRSSNAPAWNPHAPQFDAGAIANSYFDTKIKTATYDNLKEQENVLRSQIHLNYANAFQATGHGTLSAIDANTRQEINETSLEAMRANINKTHADIAKAGAETTLLATENEIKQAMKQPNIDKVLQEILNMKKDNLLKDTQIGLNKIEARKKIVEIDELSEKIHNLYLDGKMKQFDLDLKLLRGNRSDWPGLFKAGSDLVTDAMEWLDTQPFGGIKKP